MQIKTTMQCHLSTRFAEMLRIDKDAERQELKYTAAGTINWFNHITNHNYNKTSARHSFKCLICVKSFNHLENHFVLSN